MWIVIKWYTNSDNLPYWIVTNGTRSIYDSLDYAKCAKLAARASYIEGLGQ